MRNRRHRHNGCAVTCALGRNHDHARAIFSPLLVPALMFVVPQIRVANDEAGLGLREGHASGYFGSRILSRWSWRGSIRDDVIASNSSFDKSSVAKLRRMPL